MDSRRRQPAVGFNFFEDSIVLRSLGRKSGEEPEVVVDSEIRDLYFIGIELSDFHCKSGHANRCGCLVSKITDPVACECLSLNLEESKKVFKKQYERKDQYVTFLKKISGLGVLGRKRHALTMVESKTL